MTARVYTGITIFRSFERVSTVCSKRFAMMVKLAKIIVKVIKYEMRNPLSPMANCRKDEEMLLKTAANNMTPISSPINTQEVEIS